jgi:hypothetical protein
MATKEPGVSAWTVARIGFSRDEIWSHIPLIASREYAWLFLDESFFERILIIIAAFVSAAAAVEDPIKRAEPAPAG